MAVDHTHDPARLSWVKQANEGGDFPIQNLPFGVFRRKAAGESFRGGVAIGNQVVDLAALNAAGLLSGLAAEAAATCAAPNLGGLVALGPAAWTALRHSLCERLDQVAIAGAPAVEACLVPQAAAEFSLPLQIGDFTDFYTSYHHAANIGRLFGRGDNAVAANFGWLPIAYHGRASSVVVSGCGVRRPIGQSFRPGEPRPFFGPPAWLDYEVEIGAFVGTGNPIGTGVELAEAESHIFGLCLLNDWSARDIQSWEMQPLGPFLSKNFATSVSPWVVTLDALEPFRAPWTAARQGPPPLPYLDAPGNSARGALDITLEAWLQTSARQTAGLDEVRLSRTSFRHQHWTFAQMLAHHTVGGCNLQPGDLLGSGTVSGPTQDEAGTMMELARAGRTPFLFGETDGLPEERSFLLDGDTVILRGFCDRQGFRRVGLGECRGTILPARQAVDHQTLDAR